MRYYNTLSKKLLYQQNPKCFLLPLHVLHHHLVIYVLSLMMLNDFIQNLIFQYTNPLPFETEPHSIKTIHFLENI